MDTVQRRVGNGWKKDAHASPAACLASPQRRGQSSQINHRLRPGPRTQSPGWRASTKGGQVSPIRGNTPRSFPGSEVQGQEQEAEPAGHRGLGRGNPESSLIPKSEGVAASSLPTP